MSEASRREKLARLLAEGDWDRALDGAIRSIESGTLLEDDDVDRICLLVLVTEQNRSDATEEDSRSRRFRIRHVLKALNDVIAPVEMPTCDRCEQTLPHQRPCLPKGA